MYSTTPDSPALLLSFLLCAFLFSSCEGERYGDITQRNQFTTWQTVGGDNGVTHYSNLTQINRQNVSRLEVAWTFSTGDVMHDDNEYWGGSTIQSNPIVVDGVLYATTPTLHVIALNAATGEQTWRFNPWDEYEGGGYNRGVAYWQEGEEKRIFYTVGNELICLDADTGKPVASFGKNGRRSMASGLLKEHKEKGGVISPAAPAIFKDLVIIGGMGEWRIPGNISAYDARTGERRWLFHLIPFPGEKGFETWGDTSYYRRGFGVNAWGGLSVDVAHEMVFFSTGQAKPDLHRPNNPGDHLFGNSVVALDANSGAYVWHFQEIHHDLWDLDLPCAPMLIDLEMDGKIIPGLAQLSKTGNTYLFNRLNGEVFTKYEERAVPASTLEGEHTSSTQPWVTWPESFSRQYVREDEFSMISPETAEYARERMSRAELNWMTPPSLKGNIYYGVHGGAEWPGGAFDPELQTLYINANQTPWYIKMREEFPQHAGSDLYAQKQCSSCHGWNRGGFDANPALTELNQRYPSITAVTRLIEDRINQNESYPQLEDEEILEIAEFLMDSIPIPNIHPGSRIYANGICVECHGGRREGVGIIPPLTNLAEKYDDLEAIKTVIRNGKNAMPGNPAMPEEELTLLAKFLMNIPVDDDNHQQYEGPSYQTDRFERFLDPEGYPATRPPWGTLNAVNLVTGKIDWQVPLGEYEELSRKGIPPTGTENFGGPVVTRSGLIFIAATMDEKFRAFDKETGEILWEYQLPAGGYTTPSTYLVNGKQYVVIPCGGGGKPATKSGDTFVAFALRD